MLCRLRLVLRYGSPATAPLSCADFCSSTHTWCKLEVSGWRVGLEPRCFSDSTFSTHYLVVGVLVWSLGVSRILHLVLTIWSSQPMIGTTPSGCLLCVIPPFHLHSPQDQSPTPQLWQHRSLQSPAWLFPSRDSSSVGVPALIRGQRCGLQRV